MARSALRFRYEMLAAARRRAQELTQSGALFPWRTINGEEASAYYAAGTAQYHIDADIAYALCKYVEATGRPRLHAAGGRRHPRGDRPDVGRPRLLARANGDGVRFHIHGVTGPDEYTTVVNDNLFTNVMARFNLRTPPRSCGTWPRTRPTAHRSLVARLGIDDRRGRRVGRGRPTRCHPLRRATWHPPAGLALPRPRGVGPRGTPAEKRPLLLHYHPLVIYRFQVLKQADVVLALFLQGDHFTPEQKRADFEYYDPITTGDSTLSAVVQSIIAAEVGYRELALRYFYSSLFVDLADLHGNASDGVHVASTGGVWSALVYGFGGMRDYHGVDHLRPAAARQLAGADLPDHPAGNPAAGQPHRRRDQVHRRGGRRASLTVRDHHFTVSAETPVTVPLSGRGPKIEGTPVCRRASAGSTAP